MPENPAPNGPNFIAQIVSADLAAGAPAPVTRFPPEPNGYLHIGHAKSICLNFGLALEHGGRCHLRMDDTNPTRETPEYVEAIKADVRWLGFDWGEHLHHASDYFERLYLWAEELISRGLAFVCDLSGDEVRAYRGTLTEPGRESPWRDRPAAENLELFRRMRAGEFPDGARTLRARIDMASPNLNLRDPVIYRIRHAAHQATGDTWCVYPMYDYTHCLSDAIEGVTHSLCTLEFEDHRPLYDWVLEHVSAPCHPRQIEFARLNLAHTVLSKRKLNLLVSSGRLAGWDDPRAPTLVGMRRRGFTPRAIRDFCARIGITKSDSLIEMAVLENCVREDLDRHAPRAMAVLDPVRLVIENYPAGAVEEFEVPNHPNDPAMGKRRIAFSGELWVEREDYMEEAPAKFHRLAPGREVRLRYAYLVQCIGARYEQDTGRLLEIRCTYDPASRGGTAPDGRKVRGTIHWVSAAHARRARVRLYEPLFTVANPGALADDAGFLASVDTDSQRVIEEARVETGLAAAAPEARFQFERLGYFCADRNDHGPGHAVFNRIVALRDSWNKMRAR